MSKLLSIMDFLIIPMMQEHWSAVAQIYADGIATRNATFQNDVPSWDEWNGSHLSNCRFVAIKNEGENEVMGWAALTPVSGRCVYAGVAEVSVYVSPQYKGIGVGKKLLKALIIESEKLGLWTLQAGIFPENEGSVQLHLSSGFELIGRRKKIGKLDGVWRDTLLFERRSETVGV